ncbi:MAG: GIY-YIG nuclease family protein [Candidatus Kerfeldbacteria bacterium]
MRKFFVYIMANRNNNVLYVGVTRDLEYRIWEHKNKVHKGFTSKYNVNKLVYYEEFDSAYEAIMR